MAVLETTGEIGAGRHFEQGNNVSDLSECERINVSDIFSIVLHCI